MQDVAPPASEPVVDRALRRLRRVTTSGRFIPQVDGIRFIAISTVFLFHVTRLLYDEYPQNRTVPFGRAEAGDLIGRLLREGRLGVMVFFALSGFILAMPFVAARRAGGRPVSLSAYFTRRVTRIEPPYLVALALVALLAVTTDVWGPPFGIADRLGAGAWYGHTITYGTPNLLNPPFWTLEIEVQFYVLVPVLAAIFFVRHPISRRIAIVAAAVGSTVVQAILGNRLGPGHPLGILPNYLQWFLIGFLVADLYVVAWRGRPRTSHVWDVVSLIGWPAFFFLGAGEDALSYVLLPWLLLPLFVAVFRGTITSRALGNRWVTTIGGMTYSIYLVHTPIVELLGSRTSHLVAGTYSTSTILFQAVLLAPAVLAAGLVFYVLVERPCMDPTWPAKLWRRITGAPAFESEHEARTREAARA